MHSVRVPMWQTQSVVPVRTAHISVLVTVNIVSHNPAQSSSDNIPSWPPDKITSNGNILLTKVTTLVTILHHVMLCECTWMHGKSVTEQCAMDRDIDHLQGKSTPLAMGTRKCNKCTKIMPLNSVCTSVGPGVFPALLGEGLALVHLAPSLLLMQQPQCSVLVPGISNR